MKNLLRSWVFWAFVVLPILLILGSYRLTIRAQCLGCGSLMSQDSWGFGIYTESASQKASEELLATVLPWPSPLAREVWKYKHGCVWKYKSKVAYVFFSFEHSPDTKEVSRFVTLFNQNEDFRTWMRTKVNEDVGALEFLKKCASEPGTGDPLVEEFKRAKGH